MRAASVGKTTFRCWWLFFWSALLCLPELAMGLVRAEESAAFDRAALESYVLDYMEREGIPGVAIALLKNHRLVYERGFGSAASDGRSMHADTPTALGSVSKSYTAAVIMQMIAEGRFTLDTPVSAVLPEFADSQDAQKQQITIRHLLSHRSGFSTYDGNFGQANYAQTSDALDLAVSRLVKAALHTKPGTQFEYSNGNYQILGLIIERVDDASYEEALDRRVFSRLNLRSSFVRVSGAGMPPPAQGHRYWLTRSIPFDKPTPRTIVAQGGVFSSAHDVALYLLDLMAEQPRLFASQFRDELFRAQTDGANHGYGLGWFVDTSGDQPLVFHGGSNPGYEALVGFVPASGDGFVALVNAGTGFAAGDVAGLLNGVQALALGESAGRIPEELSRSNSNLYVAAGLVLVALALLASALRWLGRLVLATPLRFRSSVHVLGFGLLVSALAALGFGLLVAVPRAVAIPLPGLMAFAPDAGLLLLSAGSLAILCAVLRCLVALRSLSGLRKPVSQAPSQ